MGKSISIHLDLCGSSQFCDWITFSRISCFFHYWIFAKSLTIALLPVMAIKGDCWPKLKLCLSSMKVAFVFLWKWHNQARGLKSKYRVPEYCTNLSTDYPSLLEDWQASPWEWGSFQCSFVSGNTKVLLRTIKKHCPKTLTGAINWQA